MKKLLGLIAIAVLGASTTFAQTAVTVPVSKQTAKKVATVRAMPVQAKKVETKVATVKTTAPTTAKKEAKKVETKVATVKTTAPTTAKKEVKKVAVKTNAAGVKLKADGTPDKRYKAAAKVVGPTKKDGTADMRFKANKAVVKKN